MNVDVTTQDRYDPQEVMILDESTLDKNLVYRFVQASPQNIARKKLMGYKFVSRSKDGVKTLVELEKTADDTIRLNDLVLMACSRDTHDARKNRQKQVVTNRLEATHQRMKEKIERAKKEGLNVRVVEKFTDKGEVPDTED